MSWYSDERSDERVGTPPKTAEGGKNVASKRGKTGKIEPTKLRLALATTVRFIAYLILFVGLVGVLATVTFAILKLFPQTPAEETTESTVNIGFETWILMRTGTVMYSPVLRAGLGALLAILAGALVVGFYWLASRYSQMIVKWIVRETSWRAWAVEIGFLAGTWVLIVIGTWALVPDFAGTILVIATLAIIIGVACFGAMRALVGTYFDT